MTRGIPNDEPHETPEAVVLGGWCFYLELDDARCSRPLLRCYAQTLFNGSERQDSILYATMREAVSIRLPSGTGANTKSVGLSAGNGRSVSRIGSSPFGVAVLLPTSTPPRSAVDFVPLCKGDIWLAIPYCCMEMLGYGT